MKQLIETVLENVIIQIYITGDRNLKKEMEDIVKEEVELKKSAEWQHKSILQKQKKIGYKMVIVKNKSKQRKYKYQIYINAKLTKSQNS